jgi:hypothetical protein
MDQEQPGSTPLADSGGGIHIPVVEETAATQQPAAEGVAQSLGEAAVEQPIHVVTTEESGNSLGVNHAINPETGELKTRKEEPATRVDDVDLAQDMANESQFVRAEAADIRRDVTAERSFKDRLQEIINDPTYIDDSLRRKLSTFISSFSNDLRSGGRYVFGGQYIGKDVSDSAYEELKQLQREKDKQNADVVYRFPISPAASEVFRGQYDPEEPLREEDLYRARRLDKSADREEEWVKLLHEKPVHPEYMAAHPDFGFGVNEMLALENIVNQGGTEYAEVHFNEAVFDDPKNLNLFDVANDLQVGIDALSKIATEADRELIEEYERMAVDQSATLGDLANLAKRVGQRYNAIVAARVAERKQVLADVKSGVASQPPEPTETQQDQAA